MREKSVIVLEAVALSPADEIAVSTFILGEDDDRAVRLQIYHSIHDTVRETEAAAWDSVAALLGNAAEEAGERAKMLRG
jgi:hypothetical protein